MSIAQQNARFLQWTGRSPKLLVFLSTLVIIAMVRASASGGSAEMDSPRVIVGSNMLVSRDGDIPHVELSVASNPQDPNNLVGASITATRLEGGWACKVYSSHNAGDSWADAVLPEQHINGGGDPQVAFGPNGTAYFAALGAMKDSKGRDRDGLFVYRSEDGGTTWHKPVNLGPGYDHDVMAVDESAGRFAGRIYISILYGYPVYRLGVFRSDDDGRSFYGPAESANGGGKLGINTAANILILSDGTLVIPYEDFEFLPEKAKESHTQNVWIVSSSDGGVTFAAPRKIGTQESNKAPDAPMIMTFPSFAADNRSEAYKDRIYRAWTDFRDNEYRVWFSYSKDRGTTWSEPRKIDDSVAKGTWQYQPMLAVNSDGVVGLTWFDTRASNEKRVYDEYFAASLDGGDTFLPPARVSSEHSAFPGKGNLATYPGAWSYKGEIRLTFLSAASRWPMGGDYIGLGVDADGNFHPFWPDNRTGTSLIETATVRVQGAPKNRSVDTDESEETPPAPPSKPHLAQTDVTSRLELVFDPANFDPASGELELRIRLKNVSNQIVYAPIVATVQSFGSGMGEEERENSPKIQNASNSMAGVGATFSFDSALGDSQQIPPGGVSGAVMMKLQLSKPLRTPDMHLRLSGSLAEAK